MITWTDSARSRLEEHLSEMRVSLLAAGADPGEVTDDLRRHIDEEAHTRNVGVVTTEDVERILGGMGLPPRNPLATPTSRVADRARHRRSDGLDDPPKTPPARPTPPERKPHFWLLFMGVVLPAITLGIELLTHMCAEAFFDPIPDVWHVLLVASVPVVNFLSWQTIRVARAHPPFWLTVANAFALAVGAYYSLLYVTLAPFAIIGILFLGWGLLPLSPMLAFASAWRMRTLFGRLEPNRPRHSWVSLGFGTGLAGIILSLLILPPLMTRHWAHAALNDDPAARANALKWLRSLGHEKTLLEDSYGRTRWASENPFGFHAQGTPVGAEAARTLFYEVTGRAFNEFPPPQLGYQNRGWEVFDQFTWDADQGGTKVGGRLRGLSLAQSRLDALVDGDAGWAYTEWILEFKNVATAEREARAQISLPPGGVVSRLTLWVNGEEREAAFAGTEQVRTAYENVVKVQRRDPVLVTSSGKDRVLMQCYPVPASGGTIKVRLGITAPVQLESETNGFVRWPHFLERNFAVPDSVLHSTWVESGNLLQSHRTKLQSERTKSGGFALRGTVPDRDLPNPESSIQVTRSANVKLAWVPDPHSTGTHRIHQTLRTKPVSRPDRIIMVVDGSRPMEDNLPLVAGAMRHLPLGVEFALLGARDGVVDLSDGVERLDIEAKERLASRVAGMRTSGGQDNAPALLRAWDLASEKPNSVVLWLHGPQPIELGNSAALQQRIDWHRSGDRSSPEFHELQCGLGANRLLETVAGLPMVASVPRFGTVQQDLERMFGRWSGSVPVHAWNRERLADNGNTSMKESAGLQSSKHLARLWAFDEILRLIEARKRDKAIQLAGRFQLVTPVSGAVVLETQQQFQQAGLTPVGADTVPTVPEPGSVALLALSALTAVLWRRYKRQRQPKSATQPCSRR